MPISGCVDKWLNQKFYITQQRKGTMTWMNPKVIVLIKNNPGIKRMHTCMSCLSLAKMVESGVIDAPRVMNSLLSWLQWSFMVHMCPNWKNYVFKCMSKIYKAIWRQNTNVTLTAIGNITIPSIKDIQINVFQVVFWESSYIPLHFPCSWTGKVEAPSWSLLDI